MIVNKVLEDAEFGHFYLKANARARRLLFKPASGGILVTMPVGVLLKDVVDAIEEMRPRLRIMMQKHDALQEQKQTQEHIDEHFRIESECLRISFVRGNTLGNRLQLHHERPSIVKTSSHDYKVEHPAEVQIICPQEFDFGAEGRQPFLVKVLEDVIRQYAKMLLLPHLRDYAALRNIKLDEIKISSSQGRWGSCSSRRKGLWGTVHHNINLSLYTLLLPLPLQKLIIMHELGHTSEMNHSPKFHAIVDAMLDGQEQALEEQLKRYAPSLFSFVQRTEGMASGQNR